MKKIIIALAFIVLLSSCGEKNSSNENQNTQLNPNLVQEKAVKQKLEKVWANAFERVVKSGEYSVIDLRTDGELKQSGIIGESVMQIDVYEDPNYLEKIKSLDPDGKYAIYCRSGGRSWSVLKKMKDLWFKDVVELKGGIGSWEKAGKSFVKFDESKLILDTQSKIEEATQNIDSSEQKLPEEVLNQKNNVAASSWIVAKTISKDEVKKHSSRTDCWTQIWDSVYDVTSFFWVHPGWDDNLSRVCGIDGTEVFSNQHSQTPKAQAKIKTLYIWDIK